MEVDGSPPADLALEAARDASNGSTGKDILARYRQLVAEKSLERTLPSAKKAPPPSTMSTPTPSKYPTPDSTSSAAAASKSKQQRSESPASCVASGSSGGAGGGDSPPPNSTPAASSVEDDGDDGNGSDKENVDPLRVALLRRMKGRQRTRANNRPRQGQQRGTMRAPAQGRAQARERVQARPQVQEQAPSPSLAALPPVPPRSENRQRRPLAGQSRRAAINDTSPNDDGTPARRGPLAGRVSDEAAVLSPRQSPRPSESFDESTVASCGEGGNRPLASSAAPASGSRAARRAGGKGGAGGKERVGVGGSSSSGKKTISLTPRPDSVQSPGRQQTTAPRSVLSPRQSPKPAESFDETIISGVGSVATASGKAKDGRAEDGSHADHVSESFLNGMPALDDAVGCGYDVDGSGPGVAEAAMQEMEAHAARVARLTSGPQQRGRGELETSCTDADGSVWAMCSAYTTAAASPHPVLAPVRSVAVITTGNRRSEGENHDDDDEANPQSSSNGDDTKEEDGNGCGHAGVGPGRILQDPGELISFLGDSFLDATDEERSRQASERADGVAEQTGRNDVLSPLMEVGDSREESDRVTPSANAAVASTAKKRRRRRDARYSGVAKEDGGMITLVDADADANDGNSTQDGQSSEDGLILPPPSSARSARSFGSVATFSIPDEGTTASRQAIMNWKDEFEAEGDGDGDGTDEGGQAENEADVSMAISIVSDDDHSSSRVADQTNDEGDIRFRRGMESAAKRRGSNRVNFKLPEPHASTTEHSIDVGSQVEPLSPLSALRKNMMDQALEETEGYVAKIEELRSALDMAEARTVQERGRRRDAEERIAVLEGRMRSLEVGKDGGGRSIAATPGSAKTACDGLNNSTAVSFEDTPESARSKLDGKHPSSVAKVDATTASLIERNKTLVKEVRFADQTCVELAERNSSLQSENERLTLSLEEMREECVHLREELLKASRHSVKMESSRDAAAEKAKDMSRAHGEKVRAMEEQLRESKRREKDLNGKLLEVTMSMAAVEARASAGEAQRDGAAENASRLREQLTSAEAKIEEMEAKVKAEAASRETERQESESALRERVEDLQRLCEQRLEAAGTERATRERIAIERDGLRARCSDLEGRLAVAEEEAATVLERPHNDESFVPGTPQIHHGTHTQDEQNFRTPTSTVLAKALRSELRRGHDNRDRLVGAERELAETEARLHMALSELKEAKGETADAVKSLEECERRLEECEKQKELLLSMAASSAGTNADDSNIEPDESDRRSINFSGLDEVSESEDQLDVLVEEMDNLRAEASSRRDELDGARDRVARLESELEDAQSRMLHALHDREALLVEVGALRDAIRSVKDESNISVAESIPSAHLQLARDEKVATQSQTRELALAAVAQVTYACNRVHDVAEKKLREQAKTVTRLAQTVQYLQSQLEFQESAIGTDCLSGIRSIDEASMSDVSEGGEGGGYGRNTAKTRENVINATFGSGFATRDSATNALEQNTLEVMEEARFHESQLRDELRAATESLAEAEAKHQVLARDLEKMRAELQEQKDLVICLRAENTCERSQLLEQISDLQARSEDLEMRLTKASKDAVSAREEHAEESGALHADRAKLQIQLEECQDRLEESAGDVETLQQERIQLMTDISSLEEKLVKKEQIHADAMNALSSAKEAYESERTSYEEEIAELESKLDESERNLERSQGELEDFRAEAAEMLNDLEVRKDTLEKEGQKLREQARELSDKIEHEKKLSQRAREKTQQMQNDKDAVQKQLEESQCTVQVLRSKIEHLANAAEEARSDFESCQSDLKAARDSVFALETEKTELKEDVKTAMSTLQRIEYDRASLTSDLRELEEAKKSAEQSLSAELNDAKRRISDLDEEVSARSEEIAQAKKGLEDKQQESDDHLNRCLELEDEIEKSRSATEQDEAIIEELREALHTCTSEMEMLKTSYVTCNDKLAGAMEQNQDNEARMEKLKADVTTREEELATVVKRLSDAKEELGELQQQSDKLKRITQDMEEETRQLRNELDKVTLESRDNLEEKERTIEELAEAKRTVVSDLEERLASLMTEKGQAVEAMQEATSRFTRDLADIVAAANEAATQCGLNSDAVEVHLSNSSSSLRSPSQAALRVALDEVRYCHAAFSAMVTKVSEQADQLQKFEVERQRLAAKVTAHCRSENELKVSLTEEKDRTKRLEAKLKRSTKRTEFTSSKLATTEAALRKSNKNMSIAERELESTMRDFEELKKMNEEREEQEKVLRAVVQERDEALERLKEKELSLESLVRQREDTSNALWSSREAASKAEEVLREKNEELKDLSAKHKSLDRKCSRLREFIQKLTVKCDEWAESYHSQSNDLTVARKAHQSDMDKLSKLEKRLAATKTCPECRSLGRAVATQQETNTELREEVARQSSDIKNLAHQLSSRKLSKSSSKAVSWGSTPSSKTKQSVFPKTPLQSLDDNTISTRLDYLTPVGTLSIDL